MVDLFQKKKLWVDLRYFDFICFKNECHDTRLIQQRQVKLKFKYNDKFEIKARINV